MLFRKGSGTERWGWAVVGPVLTVFLAVACAPASIPTAAPESPAVSPSAPTPVPVIPTVSPTATPAVAASTSIPATWDREADVVVVGAGIGGMCAALAAAQQNVRVVRPDEEPGGIPGEAALMLVQEDIDVILLEASAETGGVALVSEGVIHVWGAKTLKELQQRIPSMDPMLGQVFVDSYAETISWLRDTGAPWEQPPEGVINEQGENTLLLGQTYDRKRQTLDHLETVFRDAGGELLTRTKVGKLFADPEGRVVGLRAVREDGTFLDIKAKRAVVLAPGGFEANGEALLMAAEVGAQLSSELAVFYGHPTAGLSGPYAGIVINGKGQAIGIDSVPVPGLYAIPHTAGGDFHEEYGESLALSAILGRIAGQNAAAEEPWE